MATVVKSLSADFGGSWNQSQLHQEIVAAVGIVTTLIGINYETGSDTINIEFQSVLSGGESVVLDALIAAHTPTILTDPNRYVSKESDVEITDTSYYTHDTLTTKSLSEGMYKITWYYEFSHVDGEFEAQVIVDDVTQIHHVLKPSRDFLTLSYVFNSGGIGKIPLASGVHTVKLQYRAPNGGDVSIRRSTLDIESA